MDAQDVREAEGRGTVTDSPFIITHEGIVFTFDDVKESNIHIYDIAHSLSHLCRFTGHTNMFWSVAQHSLLVSEKMPGGPEAKLVGLLHDAAEAYTNDLSSPLKKLIRDEAMMAGGCAPYEALQHEITAAVYSKFGITTIPDDVRLYDQAACVFEAEAFMLLAPKQLEEYGFPMELRELWTPWDPLEFAGRNVDLDFCLVESEFLRRFEDLMTACNRGDLL